MCEDHQREFAEAGQVNLAEWLESTDGSLSEAISRNQKAIDNPEWLNTWLEYIKLRKKLSAEGLEKIVHELEMHHISSKTLNEIVLLVSHHQLAKEILQQHPTLGNFSGLEQMAIRKKFQDYDRKLMRLQQELIARNASIVSTPKGISSGKVKEFY